MMLQPLGDHIIVSAVAKENVTSFGIIIPDTADKERPERGTVVAIGPGKMLENGTRQSMDIKVGDVVIFKKYAPDEIELQDGGEAKKYLVLSESDVMARLV